MKLSLCLIIGIICLIFVEPVLARDLVDAAASAQASFTRIGIAAISIGITIGGILFAIGMGMWGRLVLVSGFIGALAILGGPAAISLVARFFGVGL
ncbi:hypothetical protein [Bdellovibrio svalbardensis]|uniref:Conjugal transfer protein TrbC n=1 Tax=Bdellovibrio svalbardensis TaxID=2972972 RepID=A0ABT6DHZ8_9BACT|nr:hypothetical protein [Bdellovibrio svalbardensis]MDG0816475.1 hypothetical protein [Bdellovibrio svalbardensis]